VQEASEGMQPGINLPVRMGGRIVGVIGITGPPEEVSAFGSVIQKMTEILLESLRRREEEAVINDAKLQFMEYWLFSEPVSEEDLRFRAGFFQLDTALARMVAVFDITRLPEPAEDGGREKPAEMQNLRCLRQLRGELADDPQSYCFASGASIVAIVCAPDAKKTLALLQRARERMGAAQGIRVSGGVSSVSRSALDLRRCYREARTAATTALECGEERLILYNETSLEFLAQSLPPEIGRNLLNLVFFSCTPEEAAEFAETVQLYFGEGGSLDRMAERLFVHRNTVQYRITKMQRRTGYDLRTPKDAGILFFASYFYRRSRANGGS
jgi:carbohydrate diacid regulator